MGMNMFEGFELSTVDLGEIAIRVRVGGSGPPLLLLHGHPQTHVMWHKIAPRLAQRFTVVTPDLRGYGDSSKPPTTPDHEPYSKRAMARDQIALMRHFGFERFAVAGHDRGGRCAYRLALDHPAAIAKLAVLDILPTGEHFRRADMRFALGYWHWFFLAQPAPLPERLIGADPETFYFRPDRDRSHFDPDALAEYLRAIRDPDTVHAMCEDYRAGATFDFELDEADRGVRRIECPLLVLWGGKGPLAQWYDVLGVWGDWASDTRGSQIDSGHFLAEEAPEATCTALEAFFAS
jgi:haloacetate dehalogenase